MLNKGGIKEIAEGAQGRLVKGLYGETGNGVIQIFHTPTIQFTLKADRTLKAGVQLLELMQMQNYLKVVLIQTMYIKVFYIMVGC